jgi:3-dehydroquinate dehydratase I
VRSPRPLLRGSSFGAPVRLRIKNKVRPCVGSPLRIRGVEFGGPKPLFCVPLVAGISDQLIEQAQIARQLGPDLVEWRADSYDAVDARGFVETAKCLRSALGDIPIIFTLRIRSEGGNRLIDQNVRSQYIDAVMRSGVVDVVDLELSNGHEFLRPLVNFAHSNSVSVILSAHDFEKTPAYQELMNTVGSMVTEGADIAKVACMPHEPQDVLRVLQVTLAARQAFPSLPLCTMSMGKLGWVSRVVGFLYGCDMAFAVSQQVSAPGQVPLVEAKAIAESLLKYA